MPQNGNILYLPEIEVNAINKYEPQIFGGGGGDGSIGNSRLGALINSATRAHIVNKYPSIIIQDVKNQEEVFSKKLQSLADTLTATIHSIQENKGSINIGDTATQIENYIAANNILITQKIQAYNTQKTIADKYYYGLDFFSKRINQFITNAISNGMINLSPDEHYKKWFASLEAAYSAKYIHREVEYLNKQSQRLQTHLTQARADAETARITAQKAAADQAEAQRVAAAATAEQARLAALASAKAAAAASTLEAAKEHIRLNQFPNAPSGVSLDNNMQESLRQDQFYPSRGSAFFYSWFYNKVRNGGPWDYKKGQPQYENFGNFHYGAVGTAAGIPEEVLLRAAGAAQMRAGTSEESFGYFWTDAPYGDDPVDQVWIKAGIDYAKSKHY